MSAEDADWALLEIAPTEDRRAIRVAYARVLKALDPETDPKAFIRLRNAYERVIARAGIPISAPTREEAAPSARTEEPAHAAMLAREDTAEHHARAILDLLADDESGRHSLEGPEQEMLLRHWQALVHDPRMEELDHAARVEDWASVLIAGTSPLSAPILMPAAERFGWIDADHHVHSTPHVAEIARLYRMRQLLDAAACPGSRHHPAWVELNRPIDSPARTVRPYLVFELIAAMHYALPQLAERLVPERLTTWMRHAEDARIAGERLESLDLNGSGDYGTQRARGCSGWLVLIGMILLLSRAFIYWGNGQ